MTRRGAGDGSLYWSEQRQRWIAEVTAGFCPRGKRITHKRSHRTKTGARDLLKEMVRSLDDGLPVEPHDYTVADAVRDWLRTGLRNKADATVQKITILANTHLIPGLGPRRLKELTADDVDRWLDRLAADLSTDTLRQVYSILRRAVKHAQARDKVKRNVVALCEVPQGRTGRPSKSLNLEQFLAVLGAAEGDNSTVGDYIVVSVTTGVRTEEAREVGWDLVDRQGAPHAEPPIKPSISVWRSVRAGGTTKTKKSRRTLGLPQRAIVALDRQELRQQRQRGHAGERWRETGLVFTTRYGTRLDAGNVRRAFRRILRTAGLDADRWTPRELRHSFVSLLSNHGGVSTENISRLVGHASTTVTETIYRKELQPALLHGAEAMDQLASEVSTCRDPVPAGHA